MTSIFISNLSFTTSKDDLNNHFKSCGNITSSDILVNKDGRSKGLGIITFDNVNSMNKALLLNDTIFNERNIKVRQDKTNNPEAEAASLLTRKVREPKQPRVPKEKESAPKAPKEKTERKQRERKPKVDAADVKHADADPTSLYVGNLPWTITEDAFKALFTPFGAIASVSLAVSATGRSKGFGMVKFVKVESAKKAETEMDKKVVDERPLRVRFDVGARLPSENTTTSAPKTSEEKLQVAGRRRSNRKSGDKKEAPAKTEKAEKRTSEVKTERAPRKPRASDSKPGFAVFVGNLSWETTSQQLNDAFAKFGALTFCEVATAESGRAKGFGNVKYANKANGEEAVAKLDGTELNGRNISVRWDKYSESA